MSSFESNIKTFLRQHFSEDIVKRFVLVPEKDLFNKYSPHISKQIKDDKLVWELRYKMSKDFYTFICDIFEGWNRSQIQYVILKSITAKYKNGDIRFSLFEEEGGEEK